VPKFTDITLKNLPVPQLGQVVYQDQGSPLRVRVSQGGAKTFVVSLGRGRRYTIGRYGEVTLPDAGLSFGALGNIPTVARA
jgi:Arm DNA-binding domain